ncbi:YheV family putative zinc ribbon protein [Endozoicomonadaceae bacterium StTr2]
MTVKKRFIAGAVCPKCGEMDRIVMFDQDDQSVRECVSCGFTDAMRYEVAVNQPATRLDQTAKAGQSEQATEVVKLVGLDN